MSVQWINFFSELKTYLPWVSFLAGLGGSLHCVGMCGGLVTATCHNHQDVFRYQAGRLLGYLSLGLLASSFGLILNLKMNAPLVSLISGVVIGMLFIFWGFKNLQGKKAEIPTPKFLGKFYHVLWAKLVRNNSHFSRSFFIGLISIFLPCGLLYGVILGAIALNNNFEIMFSLFFFWLGTLPSMIAAPSVVQKVIRPFKSKLPKTYALSLILIGILTIGFRVGKLNAHHFSKNEAEKVQSCH